MTHPAAALPSAADPITAESPSPFNALMGYQLIEWSPDLARLALDLRPEHMNRTEVVHGGVLMAMLDAACGFCGIYPVDGAKRYSITLALNTQFIGSAKSGRLLATARRRGGGNTIFFAAGEIHDDAGTLIATAEGTFRYRRTITPSGPMAG
jgi:uncharacterized protein (TIGR00369 family)